MHGKPSARAHTAAPHCGSHCHQLHVSLTPHFSASQAAATFQKALDLDPQDEALVALLLKAQRKARAQQLRKLGEEQLSNKEYGKAADT